MNEDKKLVEVVTQWLVTFEAAPRVWPQYAEAAEDILRAIEAAGYKIVPVVDVDEVFRQVSEKLLKGGNDE